MVVFSRIMSFLLACLFPINHKSKPVNVGICHQITVQQEVLCVVEFMNIQMVYVTILLGQTLPVCGLIALYIFSALADPEIRKKLETLVAAGIVQMR